MKKLIIIILLMPLFGVANQSIDSLENLLTKSQGKEKYNILISLSRNYWTIDPEISEKYALEALTFAKKTKDNKLLAESYKDLGSTYLFQNKIQDAHKNYLISYKYYEEIGDEEGISKISNNIGYSYYRLSKYDKSLEYYFKSIEIDKRQGNKEEHITTLQNVANTYFKLADYEQALTYYYQCMKYYKSKNDYTYLIEIYNNIGSLFLETDDYYKALEYLNRAKSLSEQIDNKEHYAKIHNNLGNVYFQLEEYEQALELYSKSLIFSTQIKDKWSIANTTNNIGDVYLKLNQYDSSIIYLKKALVLSKEIQSGEQIQKSYKGLSKYYEAQNNYEESLYFYKLYSITKDSIFNKEKIFQINNLQSLYDINEKDTELKITKQNNKIKNYVIYAFGSITLIIFLLIILIYLRYKSGISIREKLKGKNIKISEQNILLEKTLAGLKESEEKYKSLIKNMHDGLCVIQDNKIIFINDAFSEILNLSEKNLINQPLENIISGKDLDRVLKFTHQKINEHTANTIDIKIKGKDNYKYVNTTFGSIFFNGKPALMFTIKDINEQKLYEQKLIKEQQRALQAKESRTMLLASISHEIKNHLQSLTGMSEIFKLHNLNEDQVNYLKTIDTSGKSILNIIGDVLDYSKIEARQITLTHSEFKVSEVFNELELMFKKQIIKKGIQYEASIDKAIPSIVIGDMQRVKQVIVNLLSNAYKFTKEGAILLNASLHNINEENNTCTLRFEVKDSGPGIPEHLHQSIFSPFSQTDVSILTQKEGTGLGLAISKNLVSLFNGKLEIVNNPDKGSTFSFTAKFTLPKSYFTGIREDLYRSEIKILTVDDDDFNINYILKILQNKTYSIDTAMNGKEGYEKYIKSPYDIILMDIQMPIMDGFEATKMIRKYEADNNLTKSKIIAVTAFADEGKGSKFTEAGMDGFLEKPFISKDLLSLIDE